VADVSIVGGGVAARTAAEVLSKAGFRVEHATDLEAGEHTPVIVGESKGAFTIARQALDAGRPLLVANPASITAERLGLLLSNRGKAQSLFFWNERRYHPGYRFVNSLIESDATWRPRYLRLESLSVEPTSSALVRWRILESVALLMTITEEVPVTISAFSETNPQRHAADFASLALRFRGLSAIVQVGMGEAMERRETLLAATSRKAYVDELNESMPLRLVEDDARPGSNQARWLSCPSPSAEELARQQCLAFLDATLNATLAQKEATLWQRCLAVLQSMDRSLQTDATEIPVEMQEEQPRFRLILGRAMGATPPSVA
jgi:hypothetical protein